MVKGIKQNNLQIKEINKLKSIFISITGRANVGKSSLLNALIGEKIAIVSDKPQTTRRFINGIITKVDTQYVFVDTPGFHRAKNRLSEHMIKSIRASNSGVDAILLMTDATKKLSPIERELISGFSSAARGPKTTLDSPVPVILLINKTDLIKDKPLLLKIIDDYKEIYDFEEIIPISVKKSENINLILPILEKFAKPSEKFYFPEDIATDQTEKFWISEIVREKLLYALHEEIPHGIAVEIENMDEGKTNRGSKIIDLGIVIVCEKTSHKGIIIGKRGGVLKKIGTQAREELEDYFECKINMSMWVKVKNDWRNKESVIIDLGLDYADNS